MGGKPKEENSIINTKSFIVYEIRSELEPVGWKETLVKMSTHKSSKDIYVYDLTTNICYWIKNGKAREHTVADFDNGLIINKKVNELFEKCLSKRPVITPSYQRQREEQIEKTDKKNKLRLEYGSEDEELEEEEEE